MNVAPTRLGRVRSDPDSDSDSAPDHWRRLGRRLGRCLGRCLGRRVLPATRRAISAATLLVSCAATLRLLGAWRSAPELLRPATIHHLVFVGLENPDEVDANRLQSPVEPEHVQAD